MLTPNFSLSQSPNQIILIIKAPMANIKETELVVDDEVVVFYSSPYYLRLHLSGKIKEIEETCGKYDCDKGEFTFTLNKLFEGEHFTDLDLLGKLLIPSKKHQIRPEISTVEDNISSGSESEDDPNEWYYEQEIVKDSSSCFPGYGFANKMKGNEKELREEFNEILDLPDAIRFQPQQRRDEMIPIENDKFSEDHYLADLMEPGLLDDILSFVPPWTDLDKVTLCEEEKDYLKELGNRDFLLDVYETKATLLSLVDILFAYAYNYRTTMGEEHNVESAWTINKLSSTLSYFQSFQNIREVKTACVRRSLIYPLYRNWNLSLKILDDTHAILEQGKRRVLKCLIEMHKMFNESEPRYLLNQLYLTDYCIWIQKISERKLKHLALYLSQANLEKEEIGLDLNELELAAFTLQEDEDVNHCTGLMKSVELTETVSSDDSEPDSSSMSDSSSTSSNCSTCSSSE